MALILHHHPLASFCWKALIALYENKTPFEPRLVDLMDDAKREAFRRISPMGKMPVMQDDARGETVPESSIIIEYLAQHYPGAVELVPSDPDLCRRARLCDRIYDCYVHEPMQKIVLDRLRPPEARDRLGVAQARATLQAAYDAIEQDLAGKTWALGETFTLADCSAAPALYYADLAEPFGAGRPNLAAYLARLRGRPSFARTLEEARPYFGMHPREPEDSQPAP